MKQAQINILFYHNKAGLQFECTHLTAFSWGQVKLHWKLAATQLASSQDQYVE